MVASSPLQCEKSRWLGSRPLRDLSACHLDTRSIDLRDSTIPAAIRSPKQRYYHCGFVGFYRTWIAGGRNARSSKNTLFSLRRTVSIGTFHKKSAGLHCPSRPRRSLLASLSAASGPKSRLPPFHRDAGHVRPSRGTPLHRVAGSGQRPLEGEATALWIAWESLRPPSARTWARPWQRNRSEVQLGEAALSCERHVPSLKQRLRKDSESGHVRRTQLSGFFTRGTAPCASTTKFRRVAARAERCKA
jgi:hypothetical protein